MTSTQNTNRQSAMNSTTPPAQRRAAKMRASNLPGVERWIKRRGSAIVAHFIPDVTAKGLANDLRDAEVFALGVLLERVAHGRRDVHPDALGLCLSLHSHARNVAGCADVSRPTFQPPGKQRDQRQQHARRDDQDERKVTTSHVTAAGTKLSTIAR